MDGRPTGAITAFAELVEQGFSVMDVTSTERHVSITLRRGRERETLTFDEEGAAQFLYSDVLNRRNDAPEPRTREDRIESFRGLLQDGFSVTDVSSEDDCLAVTLRRGRDRETLTFDVDVSRFLAWGLLGSADAAAPDEEDHGLRHTVHRSRNGGPSPQEEGSDIELPQDAGTT